MVVDEQSAAYADRSRGALLGGALGDALGRPFEGRPDLEPDELGEWASSAAALTWTDDTALTVALAEHLLDGPVDALVLDELVERFARTWQREPWRGYGAGAQRIFRAHLGGQPWRDAARAPFGQEASSGNGAAMRVAPLAVVATSLEHVVHLARESAIVTHAHPLGQDGAAVQAAAVFLALRSGDDPLDTDGFAASLAPLAETVELRRALERLRTVPAGAEPHLLVALFGNGIEAERSVPTAIGAFLARPEDPAAAILTAVRCGGDTDTIAAMTGAIAGGRHGATALPPSWLARLEGADRVDRLGTTLVQAAHARRRVPLPA